VRKVADEAAVFERDRSSSTGMADEATVGSETAVNEGSEVTDAGSACAVADTGGTASSFGLLRMSSATAAINGVAAGGAASQQML
jgi:hypothetical protein